MNKTILMVEDEEDLLELVEYNLSKVGYEVIGCLDTKNIQAILDEESIDLILMDRNLPGIDGANFIQNLRSKGYNTPVIYLTAKTSHSDILEGFEKGGDDYITKPFDTDELIARINAVIKRSTKEAVIIKARDITYNFDSKKFKINDVDVDLTHLEHDLLLEFIKNKDILLSREQLLENVWKDSYDKQLKTVNVAIKRLKEKIDPYGEKEYIKAVRGEGYIFC